MESDIKGLISDIDAQTINIIDSPNVPNGPIVLNPQPDSGWIILKNVYRFYKLIYNLR